MKKNFLPFIISFLSLSAMSQMDKNLLKDIESIEPKVID